jgi:hypothetical protein
MYWHGESSEYTVVYMNYAFGVLALITSGIAMLAFLDDVGTGEERRPTAWAFAFLTILCLFPTFLVDEMSFQHVAILGTFLLSYLPGTFFFSIYGDKKWILSLLAPVSAVAFMTSLHVSFNKCILYSVVIYVLGVTISANRGWTRRPYVYCGVLVGSDARGGAHGYGKGTSPFWVRMARGQTMVVLEEVVESIRNAAKMSLQQDLAYAKKGGSNTREGESNFNPVFDHTDQDTMSATQVVVDHTISELGGGMLLMTMEGVPWLVATLSNAYVLLAALVVAHLEVANSRGEGVADSAAVEVGFDDAKVIAIILLTAMLYCPA